MGEGGREAASIHFRAGGATCGHSVCSTCLHRTRSSAWIQPILPKRTFHFNLIFKIRIIKRLLCHRGHVMGIGMTLPLHRGLWGAGRWSLPFVLLPASAKADPCKAAARRRAPLSLTSLDHGDLWMRVQSVCGMRTPPLLPCMNWIPTWELGHIFIWWDEKMNSPYCESWQKNLFVGASQCEFGMPALGFDLCIQLLKCFR